MVYLFVIKGGSVVIDKVIFNIIEKTLKVSPTIHSEGNVMLVCSIPILPQFSDHHLCRELRINQNGVRVIEDRKY